MIAAQDIPRDYSAQADRWIDAHPVAFALFVRFAKEKAARGQRFGAKALAERVRWEHADTLDHTEGDLALNNNYVSHIMRRIVAMYPHLRAFVEIRDGGSSGGAAERETERATGKASEPARADGASPRGAVRNGKSGVHVSDRRVDTSLRETPTVLSPTAARSSPGTLFDCAPSAARWRS